MSYLRPLIATFALSLCFSLSGQRTFAQSHLSVVHVFVALADNQHQGIVPVPAKLGNGRDPANNLYWGAAFGVKSFFKASSNWRLVHCTTRSDAAVLERCIFYHRDPKAVLIADAYDGARIREAVSDFISSCAGLHQESLSFTLEDEKVTLAIAGGADLLAYVGHDAFMDFQIPRVQGKIGPHKRQFVVLACASKSYFVPYLRDSKSDPLLWTTGLMAPEAYTLKAVLDGWLHSETDEAIRQRAAAAYNKYQKCGLLAAQHLFAAGW